MRDCLKEHANSLIGSVEKAHESSAAVFVASSAHMLHFLSVLVPSDHTRDVDERPFLDPRRWRCRC